MRPDSVEAQLVEHLDIVVLNLLKALARDPVELMDWR